MTKKEATLLYEIFCDSVQSKDLTYFCCFVNGVETPFQVLGFWDEIFSAKSVFDNRRLIFKMYDNDYFTVPNQWRMSFAELKQFAISIEKTIDILSKKGLLL